MLTATDGTRRLALVVLDVVCVNVDLAEEITSALAADDVWVCATHTHSGPETGCQPRGSTTPPQWLAACKDAAVQAARDAIRTEEQGWLTAAVSSVTSVASVRSRPNGARPVPVDVVAFHTSGGDLGGLLVVLPVHPTVLPAASTVVSADLPGAVRRALADRARWVVVATGAAGDISTRGVRRGADARECDRLGRVVAAQLRVPAAAPLPSGLVWSAKAELTVAPAGDNSASTQDHCRTCGPELNQGSLDQNCRCKPITSNRSPVLSRQEETLRQAERLAVRSSEPLPATVRAARLGGVGLIGLPGEPFLDLRPEGAILIGYVGGYLGYLPTREAFASAPTYETVISPIADGEAERMVGTAVRLLQNGAS